MYPDWWTQELFLERVLHELLIDQKKILANQEKQMSALSDCQAAVAKLNTDLSAFIAENSGGATDVQLEAITATVNAMDALVSPPAPVPAS